jgi:hypothetical protein
MAEVRTIKSYLSKRGERLISVAIDPKTSCEGDDDESRDDYSEHMYAFDQSGRVLLLGTGMTLIDTGDYDHDGRSELIFWRSIGHNHEGYVLVANDFRNRVEFDWTFH